MQLDQGPIRRRSAALHTGAWGQAAAIAQSVNGSRFAGRFTGGLALMLTVPFILPAIADLRRGAFGNDPQKVEQSNFVSLTPTAPIIESDVAPPGGQAENDTERGIIARLRKAAKPSGHLPCR